MEEGKSRRMNKVDEGKTKEVEGTWKEETVYGKVVGRREELRIGMS